LGGQTKKEKSRTMELLSKRKIKNIFTQGKGHAHRTEKLVIGWKPRKSKKTQQMKNRLKDEPVVLLEGGKRNGPGQPSIKKRQRKGKGRGEKKREKKKKKRLSKRKKGKRGAYIFADLSFGEGGGRRDRVPGRGKKRKVLFRSDSRGGGDRKKSKGGGGKT